MELQRQEAAAKEAQQDVQKELAKQVGLSTCRQRRVSTHCKGAVLQSCAQQAASWRSSSAKHLGLQLQEVASGLLGACSVCLAPACSGIGLCWKGMQEGLHSNLPSAVSLHTADGDPDQNLHIVVQPWLNLCCRRLPRLIWPSR